MKGIVVQRGNSWSAVLPDGFKTNKDGKQVRKQRWVTLTIDPTLTRKQQKDEADRQLRELQHQRDVGTYVEPTKLTFIAYLRGWLQKHVAPPMKRPLTFRTYNNLVEKHVGKAPIGSMVLQQLRGGDLELFYAKLLTPSEEEVKAGANPLAASSIGVLHAVLHKALRRAVKDKLLQTNPAFDLERAKEEKTEESAAKVHCWSALEVRRVIEAAKHEPTQLGTYVFLALDAGARKSELDGLTWADIDFETGVLTIRKQLDGGGEKPTWGVTKNRTNRTITLMPETLAQLRRHKQRQSELKMKNRATYQDFGLIFAKEDVDLQRPKAQLGQPITTLSGPRFQALVKSAGVKRIKFHGCRHTVATLGLGEGTVPHVVAARLGHSTAELLKTYAHVTMEMQQDAAARLASVLHG